MVRSNTPDVSAAASGKSCLAPRSLNPQLSEWRGELGALLTNSSLKLGLEVAGHVSAGIWTP